MVIAGVLLERRFLGASEHDFGLVIIVIAFPKDKLESWFSLHSACRGIEPFSFLALGNNSSGTPNQHISTYLLE